MLNPFEEIQVSFWIEAEYNCPSNKMFDLELCFQDLST